MKEEEATGEAAREAEARVAEATGVAAARAAEARVAEATGVAATEAAMAVAETVAEEKVEEGMAVGGEGKRWRRRRR